MHLFTIIRVIQIYHAHIYISTKLHLQLSPKVDGFKNPIGYLEIYTSP